MATRTELEELNVADLRDLAAEADLEGRSSMSKADLVDALADDGPAPAGESSGPRPLDRLLGPDPDAEPAERPTVPAGGIDPALEAEAKAAAAAEAEIRTGRTRPQAAMIDPRLVDVRDRAIAADRASVTPATAPPPRG